MKKVAIIENCFECPFFIDNEWEMVKRSKCEKLNLEGYQTDLFNACPLPNYEIVDSNDGFLQKTDDGFWSWNKK